MHTTDRPVPRGLLGSLLATGLIAAALLAPPALGATEAQQGAQLLRKVEAGTVSCASLKTEDFDHIGEYVMERMLGSPAAHEAMNRQMAATMGRQGEAQAHVYMGQRFAGCASGRAPNAFGAMMGMMGAGMMGSVYGSGGSGMMGTRSGGMVGFGSRSSAGGDGWGSGDTVMVVLMALLIVLAGAGLAAWKPWRQNRARTPLEMLQARYARGEIDQREFERRRAALGGAA